MGRIQYFKFTYDEKNDPDQKDDGRSKQNHRSVFIKRIESVTESEKDESITEKLNILNVNKPGNL